MDTAAGFKFSLVYGKDAFAIECVLWLATKDQCITWLHHNCLSDLDIVDDITALVGNTHDLQDLVNSISDHAGMLSLSVNAKTTKNMQTGYCQPCTHVLVNQQKIENVKEFIYLGTSIHYQGDMEHELNCSVEKALVAFSQLEKIWKNKKFSKGLQLHFCHSNVLSTLLYKCETWHLKVSQEKKLDGVNSKKPLKDPQHSLEWLSTNVEVTKQTRCQLVSSNICSWCLNLLGIVCRPPPSWPANQVMHWVLPGQRIWGRLKMKWQQRTDQDLWLVNCHWNSVLILAKNRRSWSALTASCVSKHNSC